MARSLEVVCAHCGARFMRAPSNIKPGKQYCDSTCAGHGRKKYVSESRSRPALKQWMAARGLLKSCERCAYDEIVQILQIHHRDRNRHNNVVENIEVLCPNCHAAEHWREGNKQYVYNTFFDDFPAEVFDAPLVGD